MDRLKGKVALISGAARGQGAAKTPSILVLPVLQNSPRATLPQPDRQRPLLETSNASVHTYLC
jgi:hypothetical protein